MAKRTQIQRKVHSIEYVYITTSILVHPIQAKLLLFMEKNKIEEHSLRDIIKILGLKIQPQQIKHHLDMLVRMGAVDLVANRYVLHK